MKFSYYFEKFLPYYKKYMAKKILYHYKIMITNYLDLPIDDETINSYIFIDKIIERPEILVKILIEFQYEYINYNNIISTKGQRKIRKSLTLWTIYKNPQLLYDFSIKLYTVLKREYNEDSETLEDNLDLD